MREEVSLASPAQFIEERKSDRWVEQARWNGEWAFK
jgi:hypothetical protein